MNKYIWTKIWMLSIISVCYKSKEYTCKCDCWNICKKSLWNIARSYNCWCTKKNREPIKSKIDHSMRVWKKQGHLVVIESTQDSKHIITCQCDCGNKIEMRWSVFRNRTSCWCKFKWAVEWYSKTPFYNIRVSMNMRCKNPNDASYERYGWRWIKVLRNDFLEFRNDMYDLYKKHVTEHWRKDTSLDRIDNNWHYSKENCRRATWLEQWKNKSNNIIIDWKSLRQKSIELWINYHKLWRKVKNGEDIIWI